MNQVDVTNDGLDDLVILLSKAKCGLEMVWNRSIWKCKYISEIMY